SVVMLNAVSSTAPTSHRSVLRKAGVSPAGAAASMQPLWRRQGRRARKLAGLRELQPVAIGLGVDAIPGHELPAEDALRQRVFHLLLDGALERTRAVHRVVTRLAQPIQRRVFERQLEIAVQQAAPELR